MTFNELCRRLMSSGRVEPIHIQLEPTKFVDNKPKLVPGVEATYLLIRIERNVENTTQGCTHYLAKREMDLARTDLCEHIMGIMVDGLDRNSHACVKRATEEKTE